jgi:hypothetical protein
VKANKAPQPADVRFFGASRIVLHANCRPDLLDQRCVQGIDLPRLGDFISPCGRTCGGHPRRIEPEVLTIKDTDGLFRLLELPRSHVFIGLEIIEKSPPILDRPFPQRHPSQRAGKSLGPTEKPLNLSFRNTCCRSRCWGRSSGASSWPTCAKRSRPIPPPASPGKPKRSWSRLRRGACSNA